MYKVWYSPYELKLKKITGFRSGLLLKIEKESFCGFADCHPWPEWGDPSARELKEMLVAQKNHPLLKASLSVAKTEGELRAIKKEAYDLSQATQNHTLIYNLNEVILPDSEDDLNSINSVTELNVDEKKQIFMNRIYKQGIKNNFHYKIKIGNDWKSESHLLNLFIKKNPLAKVRLDANSKYSFSEAKCFLSELKEKNVLKHIEMFEDPCPFNKEEWSVLNKFCHLACDFALSESEIVSLLEPKNYFQFLIVKPGRDSVENYIHFSNETQIKLVVTQLLGHAIDTLWSLGTHQRLLLNKCLVDPIGGCLTTDFYEDTIFYNQFVTRSGILKKYPGGWGVGFQKELNSLQWLEVGLWKI